MAENFLPNELNSSTDSYYLLDDEPTKNGGSRKLFKPKTTCYEAVSLLKFKVKRATRRANQYQTLLRGANAQVGQLEDENANLRNALADKERRINQLGHEMKLLETEYDHVLSSKDSIERTFQRTSESLADYKSGFERMNMKLVSNNQKLSASEHELQSLRAENQALKEENFKYKERLEENKGLMETTELLRAATEGSENDFERFEKRLLDENGNIAGVDVIIKVAFTCAKKEKEAKAMNTELEKQLKECQKKCRRLETEVDLLRERSAQSSEIEKQIREYVLSGDDRYDKLRAKFDSLRFSATEEFDSMCQDIYESLNISIELLSRLARSVITRIEAPYERELRLLEICKDIVKAPSMDYVIHKDYLHQRVIQAEQLKQICEHLYEYYSIRSKTDF